MEGLNMWLVGGGLAVGAIFGLLVQRHRFCMVAATGNFLLIKDNRQLLAFIAALLVAITGTQLLEFTDTVAIADSSYRNSQLDWFGASFGGLIFGIGGVLAGGCATRTLVKSAEGSLNSIIALVFFMLLAASAQFSFLETTRLDITHATAIDLTGDASIAAILGLPQWLPAVVAISLMLAYLIKNWNQEATSMVLAGVVIGALVVCGWYITGVLAQDEFDPTKPSAITVSGPLARFGYILIAAKFPALSFAISFVIGIFVTVLVFSLATGRFKFEAAKPAAYKFAVIGGSLMGIGGIMAYGCNVGQGLTGVSTLSLESILAFAGMFIGTALTVKWMEKIVNVMSCCCPHSKSGGRLFSFFARSYRRRFAKKGFEPSQTQLIAGLDQAGYKDASLLEIGSGVGYLHQVLLEQGAKSAVGIDLAPEMLKEAQAWADQKGLTDRVKYLQGDFIELLDQVDPAEVTILDKVVCCYPHAELLVNHSIAKTQRVYALTYPRKRWFIRLVIEIMALVFKLIGSDFRAYVHNPDDIERWITAEGFKKTYQKQTFIWLTQVYVK